MRDIIKRGLKIKSFYEILKFVTFVLLGLLIFPFIAIGWLVSLLKG